ncbi:MAG: T9SS type A sorting domain-containing protein [Bacteroidota bacterium]|nr:T9SS type A sorting domain-containing protein [Bacteroidota bacterium]
MSSKLLKYFFVILLCFNCALSHAQWQAEISGTTSNLADGCFVNDSTGFVISSDGKVLKTTDKGDTWSTQATLTGIFTSICSAGNDTLYAGGNCIYRSDDRGVSWNLVTNLTYTITDIGFFGSKTGFIIVPGFIHCYWLGDNVFDNYSIYKTTDYGLTWQFEYDRVDNTSRFEIINDSIVYITGSEYYTTFHCMSSWTNKSKRTSNKGQSWQNVVQPWFGKSYVSFVNDSIGYFVQKQSPLTIFKTTDAGNSLTQSYTEIDDQTIKQLKFINEIDGYLLANNNIYVTNSKGYNWSSDHYTSDTLKNIFSNTTGLLVAIGSKGQIFRKQTTSSAYPDTIYRIRLNTYTLDYGYQKTGTVERKLFNLKNTGQMPLNLTLNAPADFEINFDSLSFVSSLNVTLNPFEDTIVYVQFDPSVNQVYNDSLRISALNMDTVSVSLKGIGFNGIAGTVSQDTIICTDTLKFGRGVFINAGVKVTICAGTYVQIMDDLMITVEGALWALGDSLHPVQFALKDTSVGWSGIFINMANPNDSCVFNYCDIIEKCNTSTININKGIGHIDHCNISGPKPWSPISAIRLISYASTNQPKLHLTNSRVYGTPYWGVECNGCGESYLINNIFDKNGGGINWHTYVPSVIKFNNIYDNYIYEGINMFGKAYILSNTIHNNKGGIQAEGLGSFIQDNIIYNNNSYTCGGITAFLDDSYISQNLVFNNSVQSNGGGINLAPNHGYPVFLINNTVCNNISAGGIGNNFYATRNSSYEMHFKLFNNIFFDPLDSNNNVKWHSMVNYEINNNCINQSNFDSLGLNNISSLPQFVDPSDSIGPMQNIGTYDWSLNNISHCINTGVVPGYILPGKDFLGNPRIYGNNIDIGAYEYQGEYMPDETEFAVPNNHVFPNPFSTTLDVYIPETGLSNITFYDATGRTVLKEQFTVTLHLNAEEFSRGIYLYTIVTTSGNRFKGKVIKAE